MSRGSGRVRLLLSPVWRAKTKADAAASPDWNCTFRPVAVSRMIYRMARSWNSGHGRAPSLYHIRRGTRLGTFQVFVLFGLGKPVPLPSPLSRTRRTPPFLSCRAPTRFNYGLENRRAERRVVELFAFFYQSKVPS